MLEKDKMENQKEHPCVKHSYLILFYPSLATLISIVIIVILKLQTFSTVLDALALSFTSIFIFSLLGEDDILKGFFRFKRAADTYSYTKAKGALIRGKQWNIALTAIIDFLAGLLKLLN